MSIHTRHKVELSDEEKPFSSLHEKNYVMYVNGSTHNEDKKDTLKILLFHQQIRIWLGTILVTKQSIYEIKDLLILVFYVLHVVWLDST